MNLGVWLQVLQRQQCRMIKFEVIAGKHGCDTCWPVKIERERATVIEHMLKHKSKGKHMSEGCVMSI
jgi:hypothetical protein